MKMGEKIRKIWTLAVSTAVMVAGLSFSLSAKEAGMIIVDGKAFAISQDCKGENWNYDADEKTLFLNGYEGMYIDLGSIGEAKIEVSGNNRVTSNLDLPAILAEGSLTITGEGDLTLQVTACHSAVYARSGNLKIEDTTLSVQAEGETDDTAYLLMADKGVEITGSKVQIHDGISGKGGAIGALSTNVIVCGGSQVTVDSRTNALTSVEGFVIIRDAETSLDLTSQECAIYAKLGYEQGENTSVRAEGKSGNITTVYSTEGNIRLKHCELEISSSGAAMAALDIILEDAYILLPDNGTVKEVSSMITVASEEEVAKNVHIVSGPKPTPEPTPSPVPTATPVPTPTPEAKDGSGFVITPRMMIGGGLVVVALAAIAVILVGKIRGRDE